MWHTPVYTFVFLFQVTGIFLCFISTEWVYNLIILLFYSEPNSKLMICIRTDWMTTTSNDCLHRFLAQFFERWFFFVYLYYQQCWSKSYFIYSFSSVHFCRNLCCILYFFHYLYEDVISIIIFFLRWLTLFSFPCYSLIVGSSVEMLFRLSVSPFCFLYVLLDFASDSLVWNSMFDTSGGKRKIMLWYQCKLAKTEIELLKVKILSYKN